MLLGVVSLAVGGALLPALAPRLVAIPLAVLLVYTSVHGCYPGDASSAATKRAREERCRSASSRFCKRCHSADGGRS